MPYFIVAKLYEFTSRTVWEIISIIAIQIVLYTASINILGSWVESEIKGFFMDDELV